MSLVDDTRFTPMPRVIALLSWYDERPSWLAELVASVGKLCDHIIALDGAYALFPDSTRRPTSGAEQAETIIRTAAGVGIGCTVHVPDGPWWTHEVGKRDRLFRYGELVAEPGDWFLRIDGDETVAECPADTRQLLADTDCDVAEVTLWERNRQEAVADLVDAPADYRQPFRALFRAIPGLSIRDAHYVVATPDGRILQGNQTIHRLEAALPLPDVVMEHRSRQRPNHRQRQKDTYYRVRKELSVETVAPITRHTEKLSVHSDTDGVSQQAR